MNKQKDDRFYDLFLVRTKGFQSIIYRFFTNSFWNLLVFKTKYDFFIVLSPTGIQYIHMQEFYKKYKVVETRRCPSYFIWEPVALDRLKEISNIRKCKYKTFKYFINKILNKFGSFLGLSILRKFRFKICEDRTNDVGFVIRMFGVKDCVSDYSRDVKFFQSNDIYKFLDIETFSVQDDYKEDFLRM